MCIFLSLDLGLSLQFSCEIVGVFGGRPRGKLESATKQLLTVFTGASLRIRFHLTHRASDFIKSLARMIFHSPGKYFVKTYIHLFLLFNTNILYSLLLINMKCFLILLNIYDLQIFFCFFILVSATDKINFGFVISVTFDI